MKLKDFYLKEYRYTLDKESFNIYFEKNKLKVSKWLFSLGLSNEILNKLIENIE